MAATAPASSSPATALVTVCRSSVSAACGWSHTSNPKCRTFRVEKLPPKTLTMNFFWSTNLLWSWWFQHVSNPSVINYNSCRSTIFPKWGEHLKKPLFSTTHGCRSYPRCQFELQEVCHLLTGLVNRNHKNPLEGKFNTSPLKISHPKGKDHLPTIVFQGRTVKLRRCIPPKHRGSLKDRAGS